MNIPNWATHKFVNKDETHYLMAINNCSVKIQTSDGSLTWTYHTTNVERFMSSVGAELIDRGIKVFEYEV